MSISSRRLQVNGVTMNVVDQGEGPAVLLVHGFPDDYQLWRYQIPALLAAGYRVIAPDMRGCGESDAPRGTRAYAIAQLVADLVGVLDALGVARVKLVGHDWGAVIGWFLCMHHPERVERFVTLTVGHPNAYAQAPLEQKLKSLYAFLFQLRWLAELLLRAGNWFCFRKLTAHHEAQRWIELLSRPGRLTAGLNYYRANIRIIIPRRYPPMTVPVLGVWSDGDRFLCERQMTDSAKWAKDFRYERVDDASHWVPLDAPDRVNRLLLEYFRHCNVPTRAKPSMDNPTPD
jgi:pimeloyl-ACP methyl ester carboxylesterase